MSNKKSIVITKLTAIILTVLMLFSVVPVSGLIQAEATEPETTVAADSTPDEAPTEPTTEENIVPSSEPVVSTDTDVPEITGFEIIAKTESDSEESKNNTVSVENHGIYSSEAITVKVTAEDKGEVTSDITNVVLYYEGENGKEVVSSDSTAEDGFVFELKTSDKPYKNLSAEVEDASGKKSGKLMVDAPVTLVLDNEEPKKLEIDETNKSNFNIVVSNDPKVIKNNGFTYSGFATADEATKIYNGKGTITTTVTDNLSGIKDVTVNIAINSEDFVPMPDGSYAVDDNGKVTIDFSKYLNDENQTSLPTGTYTVEVVATNYCCVTNTFKETFVIDNTAPSEISITFKKAEENKILKFLSFGLYSNESIEATVTVTNENSYESAVNTIQLFDGNKDIESKLDVIQDGKSFSKTFILDVKDDGTEYNLKISAADAMGNSVEKISINDIQIYAESEAVTDAYKGLYEVVVTKSAPAVYKANDKKEQGFAVSFPADKIYGDNYYAGKGTISCYVEDKLSGLSDVKVYFVNENNVKVDITDKCKTATIKDPTIEEKVIANNIEFTTKGEENGTCFVEVVATNNSGNTTTLGTSELNFDNTKPTVDGFDIAVQGEYTANKNGVYSNKTNIVKVKASDFGNIKSQVKTVVLYNGEAKLSDAKKSGNGFEFELALNKSPYKLSAVAIDNLGNASEPVALVDSEVTLTESRKTKKLTGLSTGFEIVVNNDPEVIKNNGFTYSGFATADEATKIYNGKGTITTTVTDDLSGVKDVTVNISTDSVKFVPMPDGSYAVDDNGKVTIDFSKYLNDENQTSLPTGTYTVEVVATNYCCVTNTFKETFVIDNTAPSDISITFKKPDDNFFVKFLTFGAYSNNSIEATVTVTNENGYESAVKTIQLFDGNKDIESKSDVVQNGKSFSKTFILNVKDEKYDLKISAADAVGNKIEEPISISDPSIKVYSNLKENELKEYPDIKEVVVTKSAPAVYKANGVGENGFTVDFTNGKTYKDNYYAGKGTISCYVKDELSGLSDINVYFDTVNNFAINTNENGTDYTKLNNVVTESNISENKSEKVTGQEVSFTTSGGENGTYFIEIVATNNSGNTTILTSGELNFDNTKPTVDSFDIAVQGEYTANENGVYSNNTIKVKVTASDFGEIKSQVKTVILYNGETEFKKDEKSDDGFVFELESNKNPYKLSAVAIDNLGNVSEQIDLVKSKVTLTETKDVTTTVSNLTEFDEDFAIFVNNDPNNIEIKPFEYDGFDKADATNSIYKGKGSITTTVTDDLSGIKDIAVNISTDSVKFDPMPDGSYAVDDNGKVTIDFSKYLNDENQTSLPTGTYTVQVVATNNCCVKNTFKEAFFIDNTAPELQTVEVVKVESVDSTVGKVLNILTFGIYSNDKITVTVTVKDAAVSSGISDFYLSNNKTDKDGNKVTERIDGIDGKNSGSKTEGYTIEKSFTLEADEVSDVFDIAIVVKDKVGFERKGYIGVDENKNIVLHEDESQGSVEIVTTEKAPDVLKADGTQGIDISFDKGGPLANAEGDGTPEVYSGKGTFSATVKDEKSGLKDIYVYFGKADEITVSEDGTVKPEDKLKVISEEKISENAKEKVTEKAIEYNTTSLESGIYTFAMVTINNSGNRTTLHKTIAVDNTSPEIVSFDFSSEEGAMYQPGFGIYSNKEIKVTVTAKDVFPSSGVNNIELACNEELSFDEEEPTTTYVNGYVEYKKTFTIKGDPAVVTGLKANVADNFELNNEKQLVDFDKYKSVEEIVVTTKPAYINDIDVTANPDTKYYNDSINNKHWYSGDVTFSTTITDELSGLQKVEVNLNDNSLTTNDEPIIKLEDFIAEKVKKQDIELDTNKVKLNEGENTFYVNVINNSNINNSEKFSDKTAKIWLDTTAPTVTHFDFTKGTIIGDGTAVGVENTDYGYYFKDTTTVTVTANDGEGCGVKQIRFKTIDIYGETLEYEEDAIAGQASIVINKGFKGQIYACAFDYLEQKSDSVKPEDVIVENEAIHNVTSSIVIDKAATGYKDVNGLDLYDSDVPVTITVKDTFSGLARVEYTVEAPYDTENNVGVSLDVSLGADKKGTNLAENGWTILGQDKNLVTKMTKTIMVSNNSNNIVVKAKITDNAGFEREETITPFSIDKTNPVVEVTYDNHDFKEYQGQKYYKADRTATITVTERNFNAAGFKEIIDQPYEMGSWSSSVDTSNPDNSKHTVQIKFSSDDDYTVDMTFKDLVDRPSNAVAQEKFTIDKTNPTVNVSFDNNSSLNNNYFKAQRTATITINEHNFAADAEHLAINITALGEDNASAATPPSVSGWSTSGDVHTATITFANDGKYAFTVDYKDLAYNNAEQSKVDEFYVDKTEPDIKFANVENNAAYSGEIAPKVILTDNNYNGYTTFTLQRIDMKAKAQVVDFDKSSYMTGSSGEVITFDNFSAIEDNDGIYKLTVKMMDKAGNEKSAEIVFSVNRFGSTFLAGNEQTQQLVATGYTNAESDIVIKEINVNKVSAQTISLALNNSDIRELKLNQDFTVANSGGSDSWHEYSYSINKDNFVEEGYYTLTLSTTDSVEHTLSNRTALTESRKYPVSFTVDKTDPSVRITGVEANVPYEEASKTVRVICEDANINPETIVIKLNGEVLEAGTDFELTNENAGEVIAIFDVEAIGNDFKQSIEATVVDFAGNDNANDVSNFILSASLITRFFANTPLVIITFSCLGLAIATVVIIIVKKRKKDEQN